MRISTLSVGDELICGETTDTNAGTIAQSLVEHGMRVQRHMTVGDSEPDIIEALLELARNSDAIIVTGGLGPTADDLTARAAARATGRRLVLNDHARAHVRDMSARLASLLVCPLNDKQAMIPTKTTLIPNPTGTACGFHLMNNGCFMFFLPGVPSEMRLMLHASVIAFLAERITPKRVIRTLLLNVFGPCEAEVDELLTGIARPELGLHLGICVTFPWMRITLRAEADSEDAVEALLQPAAQLVRERLQAYVFASGEAGIDDVVAELLQGADRTLALAESCTGGMIAQRITSIPGSSRYFLEGAVTYSNSAKICQLGVPAALLEEKGAVSCEVASAMAKGIRRVAGSDLGLAVTGIAGPDGGTAEKPAGTVFISLAAPDGCWTKRFLFNGSRDEIRILTAWTALDWLRRYLMNK
ncbi:MAG: CinA family nicotinamide mononucleotide deamidase-related protein [Geobacteraceae bacterium]|nr:CinA family nicotinamide mononucleotide deamidase-related protein [Geobacteraceae bacterium]